MIAEYIINHQTEFWLVCGLMMLSLEVITGFTTGIFLFGGMAALVTGGLMSIGVLPQNLVAGISCTGLGSGIIALLLWRPLKRLQGDRRAAKDNSSDLVGYTFVLESDVSKINPSVTQYSGVTWTVKIDQDAGVDELTAGQTVAVSSVDVGVFRVKLSGQTLGSE